MAGETVAQTRVCTKCGVEKPKTLDFFNKKLDGFTAMCRTCRSAERREEHASMSPEDRAALSEKRRAQAAAKKAMDPEAVREKERRRYLGRKDKLIAAKRKMRQSNPEKYKLKDKESYLRHREARIKSANEWSARNADRRRENMRAYTAKLKEIPRFRVKSSVSAYMNLCLRQRKAGRKWVSLVDYTLDELMAHLERQFQKGMTWKNYGRNGWHIDHIVPVSAFNFSSSEDPDFKACWSLPNLRPLWAADNIRKGAKRLTLL